MGGGRCHFGLIVVGEGSWRWIESSDDGAEVVDEGLTGSSDEKEAGREPPHCLVCKEAASLLI